MPMRECWSCKGKGTFHPWVEADEIGEHKILDERNGRYQIDADYECSWCHGSGQKREQFWHTRNYNVFGILANVRNGVGFAGIDTGDDPLVPIAEPRGLPLDMSPELVARMKLLGYRLSPRTDSFEPEYQGRADEDEDVYDRLDREDRWWDLGEHSFSFATLQEILEDYDWNRSRTSRGWVDPWNFELWRRTGKPASWAGGISGPMIEHISNPAMAHLIDSGDLEFVGDDAEWSPDGDKIGGFMDRPYTTSLGREMHGWGLAEGSTGKAIAELGVERPVHYTLIEWDTPYEETASEFLKAMREEVAPFAPEGDLSRIRLVFGFDS